MLAFNSTRDQENGYLVVDVVVAVVSGVEVMPLASGYDCACLRS